MATVEEAPRPAGSWQRLKDTWHSGADLASELTQDEIRQLEKTVEAVSVFLDGRGVRHEFRCDIEPDPEYPDWIFVRIFVKVDLPLDDIYETAEDPMNDIVAEMLPRGCKADIVFLTERFNW